MLLLKVSFLHSKYSFDKTGMILWGEYFGHIEPNQMGVTEVLRCH